MELPEDGYGRESGPHLNASSGTTGPGWRLDVRENGHQAAQRPEPPWPTASWVLALAGVVPILTVNFNRFYLALAPKLAANWRSNSRP